jgi:hypothetical protein
MTQHQAQESRYYDFITEGVGYLNRIRMVQPKKGQSYKACTIKAFVGKTDDVEYRECDLIIVGKQARAAVAALEAHVASKKAVIVGFRFGDATPSSYVLQKGDKAGDVRFCLKGRLLQLTFAKVDGESVDIPALEAKQPAEAANASDVDAAATGTEG